MDVEIVVGKGIGWLLLATLKNDSDSKKFTSAEASLFLVTGS